MPSSVDSAVEIRSIAGSEKKFDFNLTEKVIDATGPNAHPRLTQIMPSLVRHLHEFVREVSLTVDEWSMAIDLV